MLERVPRPYTFFTNKVNRDDARRAAAAGRGRGPTGDRRALYADGRDGRKRKNAVLCAVDDDDAKLVGALPRRH